jgi:hypothetical protein
MHPPRPSSVLRVPARRAQGRGVARRRGPLRGLRARFCARARRPQRAPPAAQRRCIGPTPLPMCDFPMSGCSSPGPAARSRRPPRRLATPRARAPAHGRAHPPLAPNRRARARTCSSLQTTPDRPASLSCSPRQRPGLAAGHASRTPTLPEGSCDPPRRPPALARAAPGPAAPGGRLCGATPARLQPREGPVPRDSGRRPRPRQAPCARAGAWQRPRLERAPDALQTSPDAAPSAPAPPARARAVVPRSLPSAVPAPGARRQRAARTHLVLCRPSPACVAGLLVLTGRGGGRAAAGGETAGAGTDAAGARSRSRRPPTKAAGQPSPGLTGGLSAAHSRPDVRGETAGRGP